MEALSAKPIRFDMLYFQRFPGLTCLASSLHWLIHFAPNFTLVTRLLRSDFIAYVKSGIYFFSSKGWGRCLDDEPAKHDFNFPTMLPGVIYDADHQCRLQYGLESRHCTGMMVSWSCSQSRTLAMKNQNANSYKCLHLNFVNRRRWVDVFNVSHLTKRWVNTWKVSCLN